MRDIRDMPWQGPSPAEELIQREVETDVARAAFRSGHTYGEAFDRRQHDRNMTIVLRYADGWTAQRLARVFRITKTCVYAIIKKFRVRMQALLTWRRGRLNNAFLELLAERIALRQCPALA
jgi:DNA-directed RNA polymerase specialized sigma24 family protein